MLQLTESPFRDVNDLEFDQLVAAGEKPILAFFTARWCAPCLWIEPELASLAWRYGEVLDFVRIDVDDSPLLTARYRVICLPVMMLITEPAFAGWGDKPPLSVVGYQTATDLEVRLGLARYRGARDRATIPRLELPPTADLSMDEEAFGYGGEPLERLAEPPELPDSLVLREPGSRQEAVRDFHATFDNTIGDTSAIRDGRLRWRLIDEERNEVIAAIEKRDLALLGGEIADLLYVIYGSAVSFGILLPDISLSRRASSIALRDPRTQISRINRSTDRALRAIYSDDIKRARRALTAVLIAIARVEADCGLDLDGFFAEVHRANMDKIGGKRRPDGKRLKPANWRPPDLAGTLVAQLARAVKKPGAKVKIPAASKAAGETKEGA